MKSQTKWRWLIAAYLFLAGVGGGAFVAGVETCREHCADLGGTFAGNDSTCTDVDGTPCDELSACCQTSGACTDELYDD